MPAPVELKPLSKLQNIANSRKFFVPLPGNQAIPVLQAPFFFFF